MKVAINCCFFVPKGGGIKEYIYNLTNNIAKIDDKNEYILYVHSDCLEYAKENLPEKMRIKSVPFNSYQAIKRSLFEQKFWTKEEKIERFDLFHSPFFHSPKFKRAKVVVTVHDMRFCRFPETYTFLRYQFLKRAVKRSLKNADHIITISEFTKKEILDVYNLDQNKLTTVLEAVNTDAFSDKKIEYYSSEIMQILQGEKFLLTVGHLEPRKNYNRLIAAFARLSEKYPDIKLVIVGKKGHDYMSTLSLIETTPNVIYLDFVEHLLLLWLYKNTKLFLFPSIYEGFGFPTLEAACFGTVSVMSGLSSLPEIGGDSAFYFDPFDIDDIHDTIDNILSNEGLVRQKKMLISSNLERFSWENNAHETINIYNKVLTDE